MKILVCDPIADEAIEILKKSGAQFEYLPEIDAEELLEKVPDFEALIVRSRTKVNEKVISSGERLKVIGRAGVGTDNIDTQAASKRGIKVLNTPDALTNAVAEFTIGLMIDLSRKITDAANSMRQGEWKKNAFTGNELAGRTYGAIGLGRIGRRVSELAHAFQMKIIAYDIVPISKDFLETYQVSMLPEDQVFARADFVDLHVPLTDETRNMVNYEKLRGMKRDSFLINTSRGGVVNEEDLSRALDEGLISGAALDVFRIEPLPKGKLASNPKIIPTPHIAGQTSEAQRKAGMLLVELVLKELEV